MTSNDASPAYKLEFVAEFLGNQETGKRVWRGKIEKLDPGQLEYIAETLVEQQPYLDLIRTALIDGGLLRYGERLTAEMLGKTIPDYLYDKAKLPRAETLEMKLDEVATQLESQPETVLDATKDKPRKQTENQPRKKKSRLRGDAKEKRDQAIRDTYKQGGGTQENLATMFSLSVSTINEIVNPKKQTAKR